MKKNLNESDDEGANELTPIQTLTEGQAPEFRLATVQTMVAAIEDCIDAAGLAEALSVVLRLLVCNFGSQTFPDTRLNKAFVRMVATAVRARVEGLADALKAGAAEPGEDQPARVHQAVVLRTVLDLVFDALYDDITGREASVSQDAARIALRLLNAVVRPFASVIKAADLRLTSRTELAALSLLHALLASGELQLERVTRECQDLVFSLLYGALNIQQPNYKAFVRADLPAGRLALLGYCLGRGHGEPKQLAEELLGELERTVLNDKQLPAVAARQVAFLYPFLAAASKQLVEERILPQLQFIMNRSPQSVGILALLLGGLQAYQIEDLATLKTWTTSMLPEDLLFDGQGPQGGEVVQYLKEVHRLCSAKHGMKRALVLDVLLDQFRQTKRGQAHFKAGARRALLDQMVAIVSSQTGKDREVSPDLLQVVVEHFLQLKEESEVADIAGSVCKLVSLAQPEARLVQLLPILERQPKLAFPQHVQLVLAQVQAAGDPARLKKLDKAVGDQLVAGLLQENFRSIQTSSSILAHGAYAAMRATRFGDFSGLSALLANQKAAHYFLSTGGLLNGLSFIESGVKSREDSQNHLHVIEGLLRYHFTHATLEPSQLACLLSTLCEILLSSRCAFRASPVLTCFERLRDLGAKLTVPLFKAVFEKLTEMSTRPAPVPAPAQAEEQEQLAGPVGTTVGRRIQLVAKMLYDCAEDQQQPARDPHLDKEEFFLLLRAICHPLVSARSRDLMRILRSLSDVLEKQAARHGDNRELILPSYFQANLKEIVQYALVQRTGILSSSKTLREIAKNMLICLGWQGFLADFIGELVALLNYRPVELAVKLQETVEREASAIGPYDMMFYSEVTKDLLKLLDGKDAEILRRELEPSPVAQKPAGEPAQALTTAQLQASLMQVRAAAGKAKKAGGAKAGGGKAGAAPPGGAGAGKPAPGSAKAGQSQAAPDAAVDKETRRRLDTEQVLGYCDALQAAKGAQVAIVWEILRSVNQVKEAGVLNYQDITLKHAIMPAIRLLSYSCTRFSTYYFLDSLFRDSRGSPFYGIRGPLMSCLQSVQENRIYQRTVYDFQKFFQHVQRVADFGEMDVGFLQMILMLANFVLQSLEVNLSVKESALAVAQEILDTNPRVKNMDLVRLTVNMMKSNYSGKSLSSYLAKLIRRLTTEELATMLQRLFEYDPIARQKFLNELLIQPEPLFCPVWFSTQMWIMQFDEEFFSLSRKIWNRYGLVLRSGVLDISQEKELSNIYHHLRASNTAVFEMTVKAATAAVEILQGKYDSIVDDLLQFYHSEIVIVKQMNLEALRKTGDDNNFEGDKRFNRVALPQIVARTSQLIPHSSVEKLLDFFIVTGSADSDRAIARQCLDAADAVVHARGLDYAGKMLQILERYVEQAASFQPESVAHAVTLIGTLSGYLDKNGQKKLGQTMDAMLLLLARPAGQGASELVNRAICKCIPLLARYSEEKAMQIFDEQFTILRRGTDKTALRGAAYACAGIVKGQGMKFLKERDILGIVQRECFLGKKADPLRLQAGLQLYETLAVAQGKAFEPHTTAILPNILTGIADPREPVRACANAANEQIVRNLSNHAIKAVVPMFLEGLRTDNWRGKYAAVEAVGNMAHCAPKQISGFLPDIVKALREVLNDTHAKVHEAALKAVSKIGSVIKCPEVAELLDVIILALGNSNEHLNTCLDALLTTSFVHAIDAPSLSLLVPLVDIGLTMHDNSSKQMASQLMGNICNLTQDPADLLPYMKILIPAIKSSLFDSIPEIRASAAKALGKLSRGLGLAHSVELLEWLNMHLRRPDLAPSERAGAAQGLSEVVSSHGDGFFANQCKEMITLARSKEMNIRESYRTVMAYLPTSFAGFSEYLLVLLPVMIEGLADESEEVRKVSMRNVKICIQQYGRKASELLCQPILSMMFDRDARVRMSSSILMYQLVKEMENDIIKAEPKYVNMAMKHSILSAMFVLKFDPIEKVQTQAAQIWKSLVDAPVHVLRMIIATLIQMVFELIQSKHGELQDMGLACMRGLVEKFGERIVNESLDIFEGYLEEARDVQQTSGIGRVILNMAGAASHRLLLQIKQRLTAIADPFLVSDDAAIRDLAAKVFTTIFKRIGDPAYTQAGFDAAFLQKLHVLLQTKDSQKEIDNLLEAIASMLTAAPELRLEEKIMHLCGVPSHSAATPLTVAHAVVLRAIAPHVAPLVFSKKFYNTLFAALESELTTDAPAGQEQSPERTQALLMCFAELVARIPAHEYGQVAEAISDFHDKCAKRGTAGLYIDLIGYYCQHTAANYEKHAPFYAADVLRHIDAVDQSTVDKVVPCLASILARLPKENQFALVPLIRDAIESAAVAPVDAHLGPCVYGRKVEAVRALATKAGVSTIAGVLQNAIMHGSLRIRVDSAYCFKYLIDFASPAAIKTEVIKICGALIRVVNDKFTPDLKLPIFLSLRLLLARAPTLVRAMVAQLQTTFLKAFGDPLSNDTVRQVVVESLLLLVQMTPKADPIVKDLVAQLDGDKIDGEQKAAVSQALALIIRAKGKTLQEAISTQAATVLTSIIQERRETLNDQVLVNSALALGFLSAHSSDAAQQTTLFRAYDGPRSDFRITLGVKLGVLLNGNEKLPGAASLHGEAAKHITALLTTTSGVVEIDGKDLREGRPDEEIFRFDGALDALGHVMDCFLRRLYQSDSAQSKLIFKAVTDSEIVQKLIDEEDFTAMSEVYRQLPRFIAMLPIPSLPSKLPISDEAAQVMRVSFAFLHKYYLDFDSKSDARPALLNLLQLTYNNRLELDVSAPASTLAPLTTAYVRETVCEAPSLAGVIPQDMKMVCGDIIFATD